MSALERVLSRLKNVKRSGGGYTARCPVPEHDDKKNSFSIRAGDDGRVLGKCFAGCTIEKIVKALGLTMADLFEPRGGHAPLRSDPARSARHDLQTRTQDEGHNSPQRLQDYIQRTLRDALPLNHKRARLARLYLESRGLDARCLPDPDSCRFHPGLQYKDENDRRSFHPALVARITKPDQTTIGILRIYLDHRGAKAKVDNPKKVLGNLKGGAIRLDPEGEVTALTEGLETGLAVREATGLATLVAVSAGNLEDIELSDRVREVHIFGDCDESGAGQKAAEKAARRLRRKCLIVFVHIPEPENG